MAPDEYCDKTRYEMADLYLDLAKTLYEAGAAVQRVTDSVRWLAGELGDTNVHIFVGYETIELSILHHDHIESRLYVIREPFKVNIAVLHQVSQLLHRIPSFEGDICAIRAEILQIQNREPIYPKPLIIFLTSIACVSFGWLNHADISSLFIIGISAFCALSIKFRYGKRLNNIYLSTLITASAGGFIAAILSRIIPTATPEVALISSVLFLIPGFLLIDGGLDIIRDHTSCGIVRLVSAFTHICIISGSLLIPLGLLGTMIQVTGPAPDLIFSILTMSIAAGIAAFGFALLFNTPLFVLPGCIICGMAGRMIREIGLSFGLDTFFCIFSGMVVATSIAAYYGRLTRVPGVFIAVIAGITMIPGLAMIKGLHGLFAIAHTGTVLSETMVMYSLQQCLYAGIVAFILIAGIIIPSLVIYRTTPRV